MEHILSYEYLSKYKNKKNPLTPIGEFVYLRTYSRYLESEKRRENWYETVLRTTEYNIALGIEYKKKHGIPFDMANEIKEAEKLFHNLYNLKTFPSGRTLYMGGTDIVKEYPLSNYNCCFTMIESMEDFIDIFYLLMLGCGVGIRIDKELINGLPRVRKTNIEAFYDEDIRKVTSKEDMEHTSYEILSNRKDTVVIKVGDSKEGWCDALLNYFYVISKDEFIDIKTVIVDYSYVRVEGERLQRFGGRASGHKSLERMFIKINSVINSVVNETLQSIDVLDIATIISENVVSGGVRRSAMMVICDEEDEEVINAKRNIYKVIDGNWIEDANISHRRMSNNSILYKSRPTLDRIKEILHSIKENGEPGFINGVEAKRRKPSFLGCNPCGEILLRSKQCCNLTTNNLLGFVKEDNTLDRKELEDILKLSTRVAVRMTLVDLELPVWDKVMKEDPIIGVSLTGMMDMVNKTGMTNEELADLLKHLKEVVRMEGTRYCKELNIKAPELMTTIKPEGTISTLPCVSSGIHYAHADYYIRRIRIATSDPLYKMIEKQGAFKIYNEVGQTDDNCTIKVIEFPVHSPSGKTKYDVSAIQQLNLYKMSMENWTDHNTSITVSVRDNEWEDVANWVYDNFDSVVGITFLPLFEETYPLLPFECTTKEDYENRMLSIKPIDYDLLKFFDSNEENELIDSDCFSGACPIR